MSRPKLKKYLQELGEEQLRELILDLYDSRKEAKEYLDFFMNPDVKDTVEKYRKMLSKVYFNTKGRPVRQFALSEGNRIVKNAVSLGLPPEDSFEIMFLNVADAISWLVMKGSINQTCWTALINTFRKFADFAFAYGLAGKHTARFENLFRYSLNAADHLRVEERLRQEFEEASIHNDNEENHQ